MGGAGYSCGGEGVELGSADKNRFRSERQCLDDIASLTHAAVHQDRQRAAGCGNDGGEHVEQAGRDAILLMSEDGPGIPLSEHQHIFRRLTRLDASRSKPGHGLGLSLVDAIMRAHGGTVSIEPTTVGLRICCNLPAVDTPFRHSVAKAR